MASPGDSLRAVWTAAFFNQLQALLARSTLTASGRASVSSSKNGIQIAIPDPRSAVSTLQGVLNGGTAPAVTDGTVILDLYAFNSYSIQAAAFVTITGTATVSIQINGVSVSWLDAIAVTSSVSPIFIDSPAPDLTHVVDPGDQLTIVIASASSDCTGLSFSLNVPF